MAKLIDQTYWMHDFGDTLIADMDREQLLVVVENLLGQLKRAEGYQEDLFRLLDSKPPHPRSMMQRLFGLR
jgi:hypothetical protein